MEIRFDPLFQLPAQLTSTKNILWQLALVARNGSTQSFNRMQESVNLLSAKVQNGNELSLEEEGFVLALLRCPWWGGKDWGLAQTDNFEKPNPSDQNEELCPLLTSAPRNIADPIQLYSLQLHRHYQQGNGNLFAANVAIYQKSKIVQDVVVAMKQYISDLEKAKKLVGSIATTDRQFLASIHAKKLEASRRQCETKGFLFNDGTVLIDQKDPRIMNIGNRFKVSAVISKLGSVLSIQFRLDGQFKFEAFDGCHGTTGLPLTDDHTLVIPNGLLNALECKGLVTPFKYFAAWSEIARLIKT